MEWRIKTQNDGIKKAQSDFDWAVLF